ncbi:hypothetical protein JHD50_08775 [Sulfurimonas sp. MAG313]|nr:hypothetical protein [Sulfurimonas sp. MAG313]MDF1881390.1 hypothetical protein [Sulfurimonas sp. MAG313]
MHTLTVQVQDNVFKEFLNFISKRKESITITKDKNLDYDPYFYERQNELQEIRNDIKNGKAQMINHEDMWDDMDNFIEKL